MDDDNASRGSDGRRILPARRGVRPTLTIVPPDRVRSKGQQVAALCWRRAPNLEILLITSLRSHRWILPKGWPEAGLTLAQSAAKEALEEAGVIGDIAAEPIGRYYYLKERKNGAGLACSVDIFPLQVTGQRDLWQEKGERELVWLPVEQAARKVAEPGLRRILLDFRKNRAAA